MKSALGCKARLDGVGGVAVATMVNFNLMLGYVYVGLTLDN